jgi:hypothetical protein
MAKNQVKLSAQPIKLWLAPKPFIVFKFNGVNDALFTLIISKKNDVLSVSAHCPLSL